jgi:flagellar basal-body rod protein FlgF
LPIRFMLTWPGRWQSVWPTWASNAVCFARWRVSIGRNGTITQDGNEVGTLGLFNISADANLKRYGNSGVIPDRPATVVLDFVKDRFRQGYVEGSGANPMLELTRLISASRAFEGTNTLMGGTESSMQDAIRTLGDPKA